MTDEAADRPDPDLVVFRVARSPFEARILVAVLEDAEIPAFVAGGLLVDEFAMSQRLMNLQGVEVQVPRERLEDAEKALAAAKAAGAALEGEEAPLEDAGVPPTDSPAAPERSGGRRLIILAVLAVGLVPVFALLWLEARADLATAHALPLYDVEPTRDGFLGRWKDSGELAYRVIDADFDGIPEQQWFYARDGILVARSHDADENGVVERFEDLDDTGRVVRTADDLDQDGRFDVVAESPTGGPTLNWSDTDDDRIFDRLEVRRGDEVVRVQELRGEEGYQQVR